MRQVFDAARRPWTRGLVPGLVAALALGGLVAAPAEAAPAVAGRFPLAVTKISAVPGDRPHQVRVTWSGGGRAKKVGIVAGSSAGVDARSFHSRWYPPSTRSITITVPTRLRPYLGGGSGNPVWVKVVQSNGPSTSFGAMSAVERAYRVTPAGAWSLAGAPAPTAPVSKLRVAEFNVQSVHATKSFSAANRWKARAPRVAAAITAAKPDLLLTAELTTTLTEGHEGCTNSLRTAPYYCERYSQIADLAGWLPGLELADADAYERLLDRGRADARWAGGRTTSGEHIFYNPARLELLDHGFLAPAMPLGQVFGNVRGLGVSGWSGTNSLGPDRWLSWARFRTTDAAHRELVAVAAHLPAGESASVVAGRARESKAIRKAVSALAGSTPVVLAGDFNSDPLLDERPSQVDFVRDGWFDAAAVPVKKMRTSVRYSTANASGATGRDSGYPTRPLARTYQGGRIDYILLKNSPYTFGYRNVMHLDPDRRFIRALTGSDHNMQLATVGITGPVPVS